MREKKSSYHSSWKIFPAQCRSKITVMISTTAFHLQDTLLTLFYLGYTLRIPHEGDSVYNSTPQTTRPYQMSTLASKALISNNWKFHPDRHWYFFLRKTHMIQVFPFLHVNIWGFLETGSLNSWSSSLISQALRQPTWITRSGCLFS